MKRLALCLFFLLAFFVAAQALDFPALTGRVVDAAHILSPAIIDGLDQALASYEQESTNQIVVVTLPSLEGNSIEDYGYQLGRQWGIGQKGKDNGALLIVAPKERKVRIEVGYGLEGTLTDAASNRIIQNTILPAFREGQMQRGIIAGTQEIVTTLGGHTDFNAALASAGNIGEMRQAAAKGPVNILVILLVFIYILVRLFILPWWFPMIWPRGGFGAGFGGGSGFGGGGFSGGGGSFGGGGASGGW